jgi:hypothetical protein
MLLKIKIEKPILIAQNFSLKLHITNILSNRKYSKNIFQERSDIYRAKRMGFRGSRFQGFIGSMDAGIHVLFHSLSNFVATQMAVLNYCPTQMAVLNYCPTQMAVLNYCPTENSDSTAQMDESWHWLTTNYCFQ